MSSFNLTAQLNIVGPNNLRPVIANIRRQISSINPNINLNISTNAINSSSQLSGALQNLNRNLSSVATSANTATDAINRLSNAMRSVNVGDTARQVASVNAESNRLERQQTRTAQAVQQSSDSMREFGKQSALAIRRFAAFTLVTGIIYKFTNALASASSEFMKFNKELVRVSQVTGTSLQGLSGLTQEITNLSTGLGVSSTELIGISSTLAQAGLTAQQTSQALKALALSSLAPSFNNMNETVEGSIALMRQFSIETSQLESVLGSINAVAAKFAVEADDIIVAIQRTGGVFAASSKGVAEGADALNQFIALFTSVRATTRESAETIATGLRTIFTRIQRTETIDLLKQFGIQLTDLEGKFVGPYEAIRRLSMGLSGLDTRDIRFSSIIEELGGFRQVGKVIPLLQQFSVAQQALTTAQRGQGSLASDASKAQQALAIQMAKVQEEFIALVRKIGSSNEFQTMVKIALDLSSALIKVADSAKYALPAIGAMLAMKGTIGAVRFASGFASGMRGGRGGASGPGNRLSGAPLGYAQGGMVPVALEAGEMVFSGPETVKKAGGAAALLRFNRTGEMPDTLKRAQGGGVFMVPGSGRGDNFETMLPEGSIVVKRSSVNAAAQMAAEGGQIRQRFLNGTNEPIKKKRGRRKQSDIDNDPTIAQVALKGDIGLIAPPQNTKAGIKNATFMESASSFRKRIGADKADKFIGENTKSVLTYGKVKASTIGDERNLFGEQGGILNKALNQLDKDISAELRASGLGDAKSKVSQDGNARRTISGFAFESFVSGLTQEAAKGEQEPFDFVLPSTTKLGKYTKVDPLSKYLDAKPNSGANIRAEIIKKSLNYFGKYNASDIKLQKKAYGGIIQRFGRGSKRPLKAIDTMGRSELIKEAQKYKIPYSYDLLGLRQPNEEQLAIRQKFLQDLKDARIIEEQSRASQQSAASKKQFGVIGLRGTPKTSTEKTPNLKATKTKGAYKSKDITVSRATLPPYLSKRLEAIARKGYRETVAQMAALLGQRAGTGSITDKKQLNQIIRKTFTGGGLGQMFEASVAATGSPYPTGKSNVPMDLPRGVRSGVSNLFLDESGQPIKSTIPTDVTVDVDENKYAQMGRFLRDKREAKKRRQKAYGGIIQRFASGTSKPVERMVGYIDSDALNDPANKAIVEEQIEKLKKQGIDIKDGYRGYKRYLADLAGKARSSGQLSRMTSILGMAGAGKSTLMLGNEKSDNATLRKTSRFPILTPEDIKRSSSVIDVSATLDPEQMGSMKASDRVVPLSTSTKEEQDILTNRRIDRDTKINAGVSKTGFGRKAGTTSSAPVDSGYMEAMIHSSGIDPKKILTLGLTKTGFRRKKGLELPKVSEEKVNLFYGNMEGTRGHVAARDAGMAESRKRGITRSIVAIGADTPIDPTDPHSYRTLLRSQKDRVEMGKRIFQGSDVIAANKDQWGFGLPKLFDVGTTEQGQRHFVKPAVGSTATVGDEKDTRSLKKYTDAGLDPIVLPRIDGISGSDLRKAILSGDTKALKKLTTPEGFQYFTEKLDESGRTRMQAMQSRSEILPKILERVSSKSGSILGAIEAELGQYPSRLTPKYKAANPDLIEKIEGLRKQKKKAESVMTSKPGRMMRRMSRMFPSRYGMAEGGSVAPRYSWAEDKAFYDSANARVSRYNVFEHDPKGGSKVAFTGSFDDVFKFLHKKRQGGGPGPRKLSNGSEIPIMAQEGEFIINKHAAGQIGHSNLRKLNRGGKLAAQTLEKLPKYHSGGSVQKLSRGGEVVEAAVSSMSAKEAARLNASIKKNVSAFDRLGTLVQDLPMEDVQAAIKKMARSFENGATNADEALKDAMDDRQKPSDRQPKKDRSDSRPGGVAETRVASKNPMVFTQAKGFDGGDISKKAITSTGTLQQSYVEKLSKQAGSKLQAMGLSADDVKQSLLVFRTQLRQTGDAQASLAKATETAQRLQSTQFSRTPSNVPTPLTRYQHRAQQYQETSAKLQSKASIMAEGGTSGSAIAASLAKAFAPVVSGASKVAGGMAKLHHGAAALAGGLTKASGGTGSFFKSLGTAAGRTQLLEKAIGSAIGGIARLAKGADSAVGSLMGMKKVDIGGGKQGWRTQGNGIMGRVGALFGMGGGDMGGDGVSRDASGRRKRGFGGKGRGGGGGMGMGGMMAEMALSMAGSAAVEHTAKNLGGDKTLAGRTMSHVGGSVVTGASTGMMMGSMIGGAVGTLIPIPGVGTAIGAGVGGAIGAGVGALGGGLYGMATKGEVKKQFDSEQRAAKFEKASEKMSSSLNIMQNKGVSSKTRDEARKNVMSAFMTQSMLGEEEQKAGLAKKRSYAGYLMGYEKTNEKTTKERAEAAKPLAESAKTVLAAEMERTGKGLKELEATMPKGEFSRLTRAIALSDENFQGLEATAQNQIEQIQASNISESEKKRRTDLVNQKLDAQAKIAADKQSTDLKVIEEANKTAEENAKLQQSIRKLAFAFDRSAQNMLNATTAAQSVLSNAAANIATIDNPTQSAMAGATAGSKERDILSNPNAYSVKEVEAAATKYSGLYGQDAAPMVQAAVLPRKMEASFGAAMTKARSTGKDGSKSDSEARTSVKNAVMQTAEAAFGPDLSNGMRKTIEDFITGFEGDIRNLDFNELISQIPEFANKLAASEKAMESFKAMAELSATAMRMQAEAAQAVASKNQEMRNNQAQTFSDIANSTIAFKKAIGEKVSWQTGAGVRNQARAIRMGTSAETAASPQAMLQRWRGLDAQRQSAMQAQQDNQLGFQASQPGAGDQAAADNTMNLARSTAELAQAQAQARQEIMNLPNDIKENMNGIMEELQDVLQERAAKIGAASGFMEKVLTSTPKDLRKMGDTFSNLSRTLSGRGVSFQESKSANVAYQQVRRQGGTHMQAQRAAQEAYAQESGDTLSMAKELAPLLGAVNPDAQAKMMGSVYESMFAARGIDTSKMQIGDKSMKDYIDMMKAGAGEDPKVQALKQALDGQQKALADATNTINQLLKDESTAIIKQTGDAVIDAINEARIRFDESQLEAIGAGISRPGQATPVGTMTPEQKANVNAQLERESRDAGIRANDQSLTADQRAEAEHELRTVTDAQRLMNNQQIIREKDETDKEYETRQFSARNHIDRMGVKGLAIPKPEVQTPPVRTQVEGSPTRRMTPQESVAKYGDPYGTDQVPNENYNPRPRVGTPTPPGQQPAPRIAGFANGQPVLAGTAVAGPGTPASQPTSGTQAQNAAAGNQAANPSTTTTSPLIGSQSNNAGTTQPVPVSAVGAQTTAAANQTSMPSTQVYGNSNTTTTQKDETLAADRKSFEEEKKAQEDKKFNAWQSRNTAQQEAFDANTEYNRSQHYTQEEQEAGLTSFGNIVYDDPVKMQKQKELQQKRAERIAAAKAKKEAADKKAAEAKVVYDNAEASHTEWTTSNASRDESLKQREEAERKRVQLERDRELVSTGQFSMLDRFGAGAAMYGDPGSSEYMKEANEDKALKEKVTRGEALTSEEQSKYDNYRRKEKKYYDNRMASARANVEATGTGASAPQPAPRIAGFANGQPVLAGTAVAGQGQPVNAAAATNQVMVQNAGSPQPQVSQPQQPMTYQEIRYAKQQQFLNSRYNEQTRKKVVAAMERNGQLVQPSDRQKAAMAQQNQPQPVPGQVPGANQPAALPNQPPQSAPRTASTYTTPQTNAGQPVPAPRVVAQPTAQNPSGGVLPTGGFDAFASKLDTLLSKLAEVSIPSQITLTGSADVNIRLNGAEVLAQLPDSLRADILRQAGQQLANYDRGTTGEGSAQNSNIMGQT